MRILFITNYYPPFEIGGYEQLCRDLAARLADRGHVIHILTSSRGTDKQSPLGEPNVHRILKLSPDFDSQLSPALQFFLTRRRYEESNRQCLRSLAGQFAPDVIFIWNLRGLPRSIALEAEAMPNTEVAYWLADYSPAEPDEYWFYWNRPALNPMLRPAKSTLCRLGTHVMRAEGKPLRPRMQHVAVVSEYMRQKGVGDGTLPAHARVIYNGVEVEQFLRPVSDDVPGPLTLLLAGRVSAHKGVHTAVEAVGHLARDHHIRNVHLYIVGSGPADYIEILQQRVHQYEIGDMVSFLGWLPREEMPELMSKCHVLLLPSIHPEGFARVVLEAMASGLTVIGTTAGGTGELLQHEVTGLTFAAGDSNDLAGQIRRLVSEPNFRQRLAIRGQQKVLECFRFEQMVDNIERFLEQACTRHRVNA